MCCFFKEEKHDWGWYFSTLCTGKNESDSKRKATYHTYACGVFDDSKDCYWRVWNQQLFYLSNDAKRTHLKFKKFNARPGSLDCRQACNSDVRCQSFNYVIFKDICELNNRTKEARPEDFIRDKDRYYMMKAPKRGNDNIITRHINCNKSAWENRARVKPWLFL